jgi:predicted transcriptional regulator
MTVRTVLSFRSEIELQSELDELCKATERDRQFHLQRALKQYLEREMWQIKAIEQGLEAADAGKLVDLTEVKAKWNKHAADSAE